MKCDICGTDHHPMETCADAQAERERVSDRPLCSGSVCFLCKTHYDVELPSYCVLLCAECRKKAYETADKFYERSKQNVTGEPSRKKEQLKNQALSGQARLAGQENYYG